jgi:hypothetical protein
MYATDEGVAETVPIVTDGASEIVAVPVEEQPFAVPVTV